MKKLVQTVGIMSAAVAFGAGAALVAPAAGAQSSMPGSSAPAVDNCGETVVTTSGLAAAGWAAGGGETTGTIAEVTVPNENAGAAALSLPIDTAKASSLYKDMKKMPLTSVLKDGKSIPLTFDYVADGSGPSLQIRVNDASVAETSNPDGFASIVHQPATASDGAWKTANAGDRAEYFITKDVVDEDGTVVLPSGSGNLFTLKQIVEANPDAVITEFGVQKTRNNTAPDTFADNITFGCEVTDFELDPEVKDEVKDQGLFGSVSGIFQS